MKKLEPLPSEVQIVDCIRHRYRAPEWAVLPQIRSGTGAAYATTADAIAFNCYPSRGNLIVGFEIKRSRRDWLTELNDPEKAEFIAQYCDEFWVVTAGEDIIRGTERPAAWGHYNVRPRGDGIILKLVQPAVETIAIDWTRPFLASLLRNVTDQMRDAKRTDPEINAAYAKGKSYAEQSANIKIEHAYRERDRAEQAVAEFEKTSGLSINVWNAGNMGDAVKAVRDGGLVKAARAAQAWRAALTEGLEDVERLIAATTEEER